MKVADISQYLISKLYSLLARASMPSNVTSSEGVLCGQMRRVRHGSCNSGHRVHECTSLVTGLVVESAQKQCLLVSWSFPVSVHAKYMT